MKVEFLKEEDIEFAAYSLLRNYNAKFGESILLPIPIDEIAESFLELDIRFYHLEAMLQRTNVLGAIWIDSKRIGIEEALDPTSDASKIGRYRFTLAHEVGHWELHRSYFLARSLQNDLFNNSDEPSIICRAGDTAPIEWQANSFAAYLLMPKQIVLNVWEQQQGSLRPYNITEDAKLLSLEMSLQDKVIPTAECVRKMAKSFHVSVQAMQIRLKGLGLITVHPDVTYLFDKWV